MFLLNLREWLLSSVQNECIVGAIEGHYLSFVYTVELPRHLMVDHMEVKTTVLQTDLLMRTFEWDEKFDYDGDHDNYNQGMDDRPP